MPATYRIPYSYGSIEISLPVQQRVFVMMNAHALAKTERGADCRMLIVPHALLTLPVTRQPFSRSR